MATTTFMPVFGRRARITQLDSCGNVDPAGVHIVIDGFVGATLGFEMAEGQEIERRNAEGVVCQSTKSDPSFKRVTLELDLCEVNPSVIAVMSSADEYLDWAGDVSGVGGREISVSKRFAFELWTGVHDEGCGEGEQASGYVLLPFVGAGVMKGIEVKGDAAINVGITSMATRRGAQWGVGPYEVVLDDNGDPAVLPSALPTDQHWLLLETMLAPPAAGTGQPVPNATLTTTTTTTTED